MPRPQNKKVIVVTYPKLRWDSENSLKNKEYCLHNLIKYSDWDINDYEQISNLGISFCTSRIRMSRIFSLYVTKNKL